MTVKRFLILGLGGLGALSLAVACRSADRAAMSPDSGGGPPTGGSDAGSPTGGSDAGSPTGGDDAGSSGGSDAGSPPDARPPGNGSGIDPSPSITFTQVGLAAGINRATEPASAGTFVQNLDLAYGSWLADLDGDGRLDYYAVNHGQFPHMSGLFLNNGHGGFGPNLFTVSFASAFGVQQVNPPNMGQSNEMRFVGDLTGDGKVDFFFEGWSGEGTLCVNQGVAQHSDWTGPSFQCFDTDDGMAFADVNGDGKIDVLSMVVPDRSTFDPYPAYYAQTATYLWRLNNGDPNINNWPTTTDFLSLRTTDPGAAAAAAPFLDLNGDGIPDKIVGVPAPAGARGDYDTVLSGQQVFLGQADRKSYRLLSNTGLEGATTPITRVEDINGDGCLDIGTDITGYRDNQTWYIQNRTGSTCNVTFTATERTALPFYPGFKHYAVDIDNSGQLSQAVVVHAGWGHSDGLQGGVYIYRQLPDGSYTAIPPAQSGINLQEFYADNLAPGDWNDDGRIDLGGSGDSDMPATDKGFGLWTSKLSTTNSWIKITLPTVTGFFAGSARIEVFEAGFLGDANHLVTPPKVLFTGRAWASQVYHFGIGTRSAVDVRVTFPDGRQVTKTGVTPSSRLTLQPG
ncbi:MAG TPA: VCBS repeat-containing protein [Kofleriaceae bacterium]